MTFFCRQKIFVARRATVGPPGRELLLLVAAPRPAQRPQSQNRANLTTAAACAQHAGLSFASGGHF